MNTPLPRPRSSAHTHSSPSHPPASSTVPPATTAPAQGATVGSSEWLSGAIIEGHYQVGSLIGRGGMSEVYYALDLWSNNPVALKILSPSLAQDAANRQKFHREERSMRQVGGGHTVGVISSGTEYVAGQMVMYIVLEYVHGCTLSQLLRTRRALSLGEALEVLLPVVDALSEVHANRYLHGDIKPGNILLDANGQVKLTDFGLSRRDDQVDSGAPMGTPAYVAPEVLDPQVKVGAQADIFALGVMMYRMLAGRLPFVGLENDQQVLYHNANIEMPPLGDIAPGIDRDVAGIIAWCTRKQPQARPEDATELFASLKEVAEALGESELSWRAPSVPEPTSTLWEAVAEIAERSGAGQMVRNTPISAFSDAGDLLAYDVYSPDSLLTGSREEVHLADVDAEDSVLNPEGIPPLKSSAPEASVASNTGEIRGGRRWPKAPVPHPMRPPRRPPAAEAPSASARRPSRSLSRPSASTPPSTPSARSTPTPTTPKAPRNRAGRTPPMVLDGIPAGAPAPPMPPAPRRGRLPTATADCRYVSSPLPPQARRWVCGR